MKAITFRAIRDLTVADVPGPTLQDPRDVIVEVELSAICGSDLHPYRGAETGLDVGTIFGHEFLGRVVERGADVSLPIGARVVAPFTTNCGVCWYCEQGLTARCEEGSLFGWVQNGQGLHGGQAERVRVPLADATLMVVPEGAHEEEALFSGDILSTGAFVTELGDVGSGDSVAVIGAGPVGLMAAVASREAGASRVYVLDSVAERLELAKTLGATPLDHTDPKSRERLLDETAGRGVDAALECVGSPGATRGAIDVVRLGGTVAAAGVHTEEHFAFSPGEAYDKNLTYRAGRCPARRMMDKTLALVGERRLGLDAIVSHRLPLEAGVDAYRMFDERTSGCTKVVLKP